MTTIPQTSSTTKCAHCGRDFPGEPVSMVGYRHACCSVECGDRFARHEVCRLEEWLSLIAKKSRGTAGDYARSALYSNLPAFRKAKI